RPQPQEGPVRADQRQGRPGASAEKRVVGRQERSRPGRDPDVAAAEVVGPVGAGDLAAPGRPAARPLRAGEGVGGPAGGGPAGRGGGRPGRPPGRRRRAPPPIRRRAGPAAGGRRAAPFSRTPAAPPSRAGLKSGSPVNRAEDGNAPSSARFTGLPGSSTRG